jgi:predicted metalloprotease with PDZ domain
VTCPERSRRARALLFVFCLVPTLAAAQAPVRYRLSFPEPEHRWMQVEVTFPELPAGTLQIRMSRSSPGRYALHEFAKNVYDVRVTDGGGKPLIAARPNPHQWDVSGHDGTVRVTYRIFGDRVDGTYLSIDTTHAHINMPAALMWARGLERRPATVRFEPPAGATWRVATQLFPGADANTFTAPNLQYLMDSPSEFGAFALRTFSVEDSGGRKPTFRVAVHHQGSDEELAAYARDTEAIVREARNVYGEYPAFENNTYTFLADYLPWANGDGMEHRNSTVLTSSGSLRASRAGLLGTVSHEFFHSWNVERIRPQSLEPFNFEEANMSGELWLAEGFTSYYGPLIVHRAGLTDAATYARSLSGTINAVMFDPGRRIRTAEEMSRFAPFVDAATSIDPTNFSNTFISYYTWGAAIGLGLDLSLRELWREFGKSGERVPGYVEKPYGIPDLKRVLGEVSGDPAFAADFFASFIQGHEVVDYARLLGRAGFVVRPQNKGAAYVGSLSFESDGGAKLVESVPFDSPAYKAGLERHDIIVSLAERAVRSADEFERLLREQKPGSAVPIEFERRGTRTSATIRPIEDPRIEVVPAEEAGQTLTDAQRGFRDAWLRSQSPQR